MKKIIASLLLFICILAKTGAQNVYSKLTVKDKIQTGENITFQNAATDMNIADGKVESTGTVIFDHGKINLKNVTIKATEIIFSNLTAVISVEDKVHLECEKITINAGVGNITLESSAGDGELNISYSKQFINSSSRNFVFNPQQATDVLIKVKKIN